MLRRTFIVLACVALAGSACSKKPSTSAKPKTPAANTFTVQVDAHKASNPFNLAATAFYPQLVSVHAGDTVVFKLNSSGEPHTVTFGTALNANLPVPGASPTPPKPSASGNEEEEPAAIKAFPQLIPDDPRQPMPQGAAQPCFLPSGYPTGLTACTADQQKQPDFNGQDSFYNSGYLGPEASFTMKVAATTAPGSYKFFCLLHREGMTGAITVAPSTQTTKSPADVLAEGDAGIAKSLQKATPVNTQFAKVRPGHVVGAGGLLGENDAEFIAAFGPSTVNVPAGGTVTWDVGGAHTLSFNAPTDASPLVVKNPDGSLQINPKAFAPSGGAKPFAGEPGKKATVDGGTYAGEGFFNSGFLPGFGPPGTLLYKVKFTKQGTYKYVCLIHLDMTGYVKVA